MVSEFNAIQLTSWKLKDDGKNITLAFEDDKNNGIRIHVPRYSFEPLLPIIARELMQDKTPREQSYISAVGLDLGVAKDDGSVNLMFDLGIGAPFCIHLPAGSALMLMEGLKAIETGTPPQRSRRN